MTRRKTDPRHPRPPWHRRPLPWRFDDWAAI
jgi:hypothetical protein